MSCAAKSHCTIIFKWKILPSQPVSAAVLYIMPPGMTKIYIGKLIYFSTISYEDDFYMKNVLWIRSTIFLFWIFFRLRQKNNIKFQHYINRVPEFVGLEKSYLFYIESNKDTLYIQVLVLNKIYKCLVLSFVS